MSDVISLIFDPADLTRARVILETLEASGFHVISYDPSLTGGQQTSESRSDRLAALYDEKNLGCLVLISRDFARNLHQRYDRLNFIRALRRKQSNLQFVLTDPDLDYFLDRDLDPDGDAEAGSRVRLRDYSYADFNVFGPAQISEIYSKKRDTFGKVATIDGYYRVRDIVELALPNAIIHDLSGRVRSVDQGIGFQIFEGVEEHLGSRRTYFVHLFKSIVLKNTSDAIRASFPDILGRADTVILLERSEIEHPSTRVRNVQRLFDTKNVQFIPEFVWALASKAPLPRSDTIGEESADEVFIPPKALTDDNQPTDKLVTALLGWLGTPGGPILILTGPGGSGKTTLLMHILHIMSRRPQTRIHLISSRDVVEQFRKQPPTANHLTLYELYVAQMRQTGETYLEEKLFRLCLEQGRCHLLIDGLDEIISQLPSLWQDLGFLDSMITEDSDELFAKVTITCRSSFFSDSTLSHYKDRIIRYSLIPFDQAQAEAYIEAAFPGDASYRRTAKRLLEDLTPAKVDVLPFVLAIIKYLVERKTSIDSALQAPDTDLLSGKLNTDTILWRICIRESQKQDFHLDPEDQIWMLATLAATAERGPWLEEALPKYAQEILKRPVPDQSLKWFLEHPFLIRSPDKNIRFRFDFLQGHFSNVYLAMALQGKLTSSQSSPDRILDLVSEYCGLNTPFNRDLAVRIMDDHDQAKLRVIDLIAHCRQKRDEGSLALMEYASLVFRLFGILLQKLVDDQKNNIQNYTELVGDIFGADGGGIIRGLCMVDDGGLQEARIRFDLSNLTMEDCIFVGYPDLWSCRANENTRFERCRIQVCHGPAPTRSGMKEAKFSATCVMDGSAVKNIKGFTQRSDARRSQAEGAIRSVLGDFRSRGGMRPKSKSFMQGLYRPQGPFVFDDVWDPLVKRGLIVPDGGSFYRINPSHMSRVEKFIYDALPFGDLDTVISDLMA